MHPLLNARDREILGQHNISVDEAGRQITLIQSQQRGVDLARPCTLDDGIRRLSEQDHSALAAMFDDSVREGRWTKFVPASGAASRMFELKNDDDAQQLLNNLDFFAFFDDLIQACRRAGLDLNDPAIRNDRDKVLPMLLGTDGLNYSNLPKGLLNFHRYPDGSRTAFEEQLREAAVCFRDNNGCAQAHFTVSPEHEPLFQSLLSELRPAFQDQLKTELDVSYSIQKSSTNTLALEMHDELLRDSNGDLVLRPAGHGALLENIGDLPRADLLFLKNIDNVCHQRLAGPTQIWIRALGGYLVRLQAEIHSLLCEMNENPSAENCRHATAFIRSQLPRGLPHDAQAAKTLDHIQIRQILDRPLRVCGVVKNEGEPGGGPFWVRDRDGSERLQIVESAEIDNEDKKNRELFASGTYFNPVFMAIGVRDHKGQPFDLQQFVNQERYIFADKKFQGRDTRVLERPGLWNGAMHNWNTVFIEVPIAVFSPVKTLFDWLRDAHQPLHAAS